MSDEIDLSGIGMYAVRNKEGKWFRAKGYNNYGKTWVDSLKSARVYNKPGPARRVVSFFAERWPEFGVPDIVHFVVTEVRVLDEAGRIEKQKQKRAEAEARQKKAEAQRQLEQAEAALLAAQIRLEAAKASAKKGTSK